MGIKFYWRGWVYKPKNKKLVGLVFDNSSTTTGLCHTAGASSSQAPPAVVVSSEMMALLQSIFVEVWVNTTETRANSTAIRELSLQVQSLERRVAEAEIILDNPIRAPPQPTHAQDASMSSSSDDGDDVDMVVMVEMMRIMSIMRISSSCFYLYHLYTCFNILDNCTYFDIFPGTMLPVIFFILLFEIL